MGRIKEKGHEGVEHIRETGQETTEAGSEMLEDAHEIESILEGIQVSDEDDVSAIESTGSGYQGSFDGAFSEQIESKAEEIHEESEGLQDEMGSELERVQEGISSLEQAAGVSEIGRENAEQGRGALEGSAEEYEGIISDAAESSEEISSRVQEMKSDLSGVF